MWIASKPTNVCIVLSMTLRSLQVLVLTRGMIAKEVVVRLRLLQVYATYLRAGTNTTALHAGAAHTSFPI